MKETQTPSNNHGQKRKGRPSKYTRKTVRVICAAVADGVPLKHAAAIAGVAEATLHDWKRTIPTFSESIEAAIARGILSRLKVIKRASDRGDVRAACWYLEHVHPTHYAKSRVDVLHTVASEGALVNSNGKLNLDTAMEELSPVALRTIMADILSGRATRFQGKFAAPIIDLPPHAAREEGFPNTVGQLALESIEEMPGVPSPESADALPERLNKRTSKMLHA